MTNWNECHFQKFLWTPNRIGLFSIPVKFDDPDLSKFCYSWWYCYTSTREASKHLLITRLSLSFFSKKATFDTPIHFNNYHIVEHILCFVQLVQVVCFRFINYVQNLLTPTRPTISKSLKIVIQEELYYHYFLLRYHQLNLTT